MSKYILAYDMLCFLSCTRYSLRVYQCSLVYRFMINLFSIYKKALLIPRSGLGEYTRHYLIWPAYLFELFAIIIPCLSWAQQKSTADKWSSWETGSCVFLGSWARMKSQTARNDIGGESALDGHSCCFEQGNEGGQNCACAPTKTHEDTMQGRAHGASCPAGLPMATGSPSCEYVTYAHVWHQSVETSGIFSDCFHSSAC